MLYYRNNRGPRGRMFGHGGRRPGLMILGILGLIGFAPVGLAVLFGLLVGVIGVFGGLIGAADGLIGATAEIMSEMPSAVYSGGGLVIGIVIGLILYNRRKNRNTASDDAREEEINASCAQEETEYYPTETYRHFGA